MKKILQDSFQFKIVKVDGKKKLELLARDYYQHFLNTKTKENEIGTMFLTFKKPTRSEQQLRYYWVVVGILANEQGYTSEELHEWLMIMKFGTKQVTVGGVTKEVRRSISNKARMSKLECMELLDFTLEKCAELEIHIPTRQELGYID